MNEKIEKYFMEAECLDAKNHDLSEENENLKKRLAQFESNASTTCNIKECYFNDVYPECPCNYKDKEEFSVGDSVRAKGTNDTVGYKVEDIGCKSLMLKDVVGKRFIAGLKDLYEKM